MCKWKLSVVTGLALTSQYCLSACSFFVCVCGLQHRNVSVVDTSIAKGVRLSQTFADSFPHSGLASVHGGQFPPALLQVFSVQWANVAPLNYCNTHNSMQDAPHHCPVCFSSTWSLNSGVLICETCGTQSQVSHSCSLC